VLKQVEHPAREVGLFASGDVRASGAIVQEMLVKAKALGKQFGYLVGAKA